MYDVPIINKSSHSYWNKSCWLRPSQALFYRKKAEISIQAYITSKILNVCILNLSQKLTLLGQYWNILNTIFFWQSSRNFILWGFTDYYLPPASYAIHSCASDFKITVNQQIFDFQTNSATLGLHKIKYGMQFFRVRVEFSTWRTVVWGVMFVWSIFSTF